MLDFKKCPFCDHGLKIEPGHSDVLNRLPVIRYNYTCGLIGYFYFKRGYKQHFDSTKCIENRRINAITQSNASDSSL